MSYIIIKKIQMENKEGCKTCKKGLSGTHWSMIIVSFYILFAAIYGTVKLIGEIMSNF
jgi:hypothetical protein